MKKVRVDEFIRGNKYCDRNRDEFTVLDMEKHSGGLVKIYYRIKHGVGHHEMIKECNVEFFSTYFKFGH